MYNFTDLPICVTKLSGFHSFKLTSITNYEPRTINIVSAFNNYQPSHTLKYTTLTLYYIF